MTNWTRCLSVLAVSLMMAAASLAAEVEAGSDVRLRIAVVDFSAAFGRPFSSCDVKVTPLSDAGNQLSGAISERLGTWPEYAVIDREEVRKAVARYKLSKHGFSKPSSLLKLAEVLGADAVVLGQTEGSAWTGKGHEGGSLYASLQMVSTADQRVLWSIDGNTTSLTSSKDVVLDLAESLTKDLFAKLVEGGGVRPLLAMHRPER